MAKKNHGFTLFFNERGVLIIVLAAGLCQLLRTARCRLPRTKNARPFASAGL